MRTTKSLASLPVESRYYKNYAWWLGYARAAGFESVNGALEELYAEHGTYRRVAAYFGEPSVSGATIGRHLRRICPERLRGRGGANNRKGRRVIYMWAGIPLKQWCREHGGNYGRIMQRVKRYGWSLRRAVETGVCKPYVRGVEK